MTVQDVEAIDKKFLVRANPELGSYLYDAGDRVFYRDPNDHPQGPGAQTLTEEEFGQYAAAEDSSGVKVLVKMKGGV